MRGPPQGGLVKDLVHPPRRLSGFAENCGHTRLPRCRPRRAAIYVLMGLAIPGRMQLRARRGRRAAKGSLYDRSIFLHRQRRYAKRPYSDHPALMVNGTTLL